MTLDEFTAEVELGVQDALADNPDVTEEDVFHDIAWSIGFSVDEQVRNEFWLINFGRKFPQHG